MDLQSIYAFAAELWVVWLMAIFIGIIVWVYLPGNRAKWEKRGRIPLEDDPDGRSAAGSVRPHSLKEC